jgi:YggT family protein
VAFALQIVYLVLFFFLYILYARFILQAIMAFGRRWRPGRAASAAMEMVWSVTDPPVKALRRVIPPLRLGGMSLDLASLVLVVIVLVLMSLVLQPVISNLTI